MAGQGRRALKGSFMRLEVHIMENKLTSGKCRISPAGQRRDMTRQDTRAAVTLGANLREAMEWQREHRQ